MQAITNRKPTTISHGPWPCIQSTPPAAIAPTEIAPRIGQGLGSTRW
jgi:hypothetical protein